MFVLLLFCAYFAVFFDCFFMRISLPVAPLAALLILLLFLCYFLMKRLLESNRLLSSDVYPMKPKEGVKAGGNAK